MPCHRHKLTIKVHTSKHVEWVYTQTFVCACAQHRFTRKYDWEEESQDSANCVLKLLPYHKKTVGGVAFWKKWWRMHQMTSSSRGWGWGWWSRTTLIFHKHQICIMETLGVITFCKWSVKEAYPFRVLPWTSLIFCVFVDKDMPDTKM